MFSCLSPQKSKKPPPGPVGTWDTADVSQWLRALDLPSLVLHFQQNSISGPVLLTLSPSELAELVPNKFHRRKIAISLAANGSTQIDKHQANGNLAEATVADPRTSPAKTEGRQDLLMAYLEDAQKAHAVPLHSHDDSDRTPTSPRESDGTASTAAGKQTFAERLAARGHGSPKLVAQIPATPVQSSSSLKRLHKKESLRRESAGAAGSHRQGQYSALRTLSAAERAPMSVTESQREAGRGTNSDASLPSFSGMTNGLSPWQVELTERKASPSRVRATASGRNEPSPTRLRGPEANGNPVVYGGGQQQGGGTSPSRTRLSPARRPASSPVRHQSPNSRGRGSTPGRHNMLTPLPSPDGPDAAERTPPVSTSLFHDTDALPRANGTPLRAQRGHSAASTAAQQQQPQQQPPPPPQMQPVAVSADGKYAVYPTNMGMGVMGMSPQALYAGNGGYPSAVLLSPRGAGGGMPQHATPPPQQLLSPRGYTPQQAAAAQQMTPRGGYAQTPPQQQQQLLSPRGGYAGGPGVAQGPLSPRMGPVGPGGTPLSPRQLTPQMVQQQLLQQQRLQQIAAQQQRLQQAASPLSPRGPALPRPGPPASPPAAHQRLETPPFSGVPPSLQQHYHEMQQQYAHQQERLMLYQQQQSQQTAELHASRQAAAQRRLSLHTPPGAGGAGPSSHLLAPAGADGASDGAASGSRHTSPSKGRRSPGSGLAAADALLERIRQERARAESSAGPSSSQSSPVDRGRDRSPDKMSPSEKAALYLAQAKAKALEATKAPGTPRDGSGITAMIAAKALNALALEAEDEAARRREEAQLRMEEAAALRMRQEELRSRRADEEAEERLRAMTEAEQQRLRALDEEKAALWAKGGVVVSAGEDKTVRIWKLADGQCEKVLRAHKRAVTCLSVLRDGRVVSGSEDKTVRVWRMTDGSCQLVLMGHSDVVLSCCGLPNVDLVASGSKDNSIRIWRLTPSNTGKSAGECERELVGHTGPVLGLLALPYAPGGDKSERLMSCSYDSTLRLWARATTGLWGLQKVYEGHTGRVNGLTCLDPDRVVSASEDKTLRLWRLSTGACESVMDGHTGEVKTVTSLGVGNTRVVSGSFDCTVRCWRVADGGCEWTLKGHNGHVQGVLALRAGRVASASKDGAVCVWNLQTGQKEREFKGHQGWVNAIAALDV